MLWIRNVADCVFFCDKVAEVVDTLARQKELGIFFRVFLWWCGAEGIEADLTLEFFFFEWREYIPQALKVRREYRIFGETAAFASKHDDV